MRISLSAKTAGCQAQGAERSGACGQALQRRSRLFLHNPKGEALSAARIVAAFAGIPHASGASVSHHAAQHTAAVLSIRPAAAEVLFQAAPRGGGGNRSREMRIIYVGWP